MTLKEESLHRNFSVRVVQESDLEELSALAHRIWKQHYTPIIGSAQVEYMLGLWYGAEFLGKQMRDATRQFLLVEQAEQLKAYIQSSEQNGACFIHKLYVAPECQGQGMGKALLGALPTHLPLQLRVNRHNDKSIAFYKRYGFTVIGEDVLDIGDGYTMDDYIMKKSILAS